MLSEPLFEYIVERQNVSMGNEDVSFQEHKASKQLAMLLNSLIEHIPDVVILHCSRLTNRLSILEVMLHTSDRRSIINLFAYSDILSGNKGLIEGDLDVICSVLLIEVGILR